MIRQPQNTQELFSIITQYNSIQDIKETLKLFMDTLKDATLNTLLTEDKEYQTNHQAYLHAYESYQNGNFFNSQRIIVDKLLDQKDECHLEHITDAYLAGLIDSYRILKLIGIVHEA